ncbi:MAG TPA: RNA polymerase sigma factor SigJ [Kofleriaceae bacterium]|nr:RNA polymerase sigma factor SigJ [Kofleriaceae bacterium]
MELLSGADPVAAFEAHRNLLHGIAYRMLGSVADTEDILQEARIRWLDAPRDDVDSPRAYLVTVVSRLCLDALGSARARRETYVGEWLPEPIATTPDSDARDMESVSMAFLVLLERLSPSERAAFLLADVFDYSFAEVATALGKTEDACRQLAARARRHIKDARPKPIDRDAHARALAAFISACGTGDVVALERLLAADVVAHTDSGGRARAARNAVAGADRVARLYVGLARKGTTGATLELHHINGLPAIILREHGAITTVLSVDLSADGRIQSIFAVRNPDKLSHLQLTPAG